MADGRRPLILLVTGLVMLSLAAYAGLHLLRNYRGGMTVGIPIRKIALVDAPLAVRQAAEKLAPSKVGYVVAQENQTYLIISTGLSGDKIALAGARRSGAIIDVNLKAAPDGDRLMIALMQAQVADSRLVQFKLDGQAGAVPALVNTHGLLLRTLPDIGAIALVSPVPTERLAGTTVEVSGYARLYAGTFSATIYSAGKGRVLGESRGVVAATGAPNWGSFKAHIDVNLPPDVTDAIVVVFDEESGAKTAVPIKFGPK